MSGPVLAPPRGTILRDYQARVLRHLLCGVLARPAATFTVMFPRQSGKNEVSAMLVAILLRMRAERGGSIIVCEPTLTPQAGISLERTLHVLAASDHLFAPAARARPDGNRIAVGRATATFLSASPAAHVAGHTASIALIADEAQDIDEEWFGRQFRPMAAATAAPTVMFGTAWDGESLLEHAADANRAFDATGADDIPRHYQAGWREVAQSVPAYGAYVESERRRLGPHHPLFVTQYELASIEGGGRLLSAGQLSALDGEYPRLAAPRVGEIYVAGLDFGGDGVSADRTVLTIARAEGGGCEVVSHAAWRSAPFETLLRELSALIQRWQPVRLAADATGLGGPLCARLEPLLGDRLERFVFTATSKSELGYALIAAAETGQLRLYADDGSPESAACRAELRAARARPASGGLLRWEAPAGGHDDYVASLALCLRAATALPAPRIARGRR